MRIHFGRSILLIMALGVGSTGAYFSVKELHAYATGSFSEPRFRGNLRRDDVQVPYSSRATQFLISRCYGTVWSQSLFDLTFEQRSRILSGCDDFGKRILKRFPTNANAYTMMAEAARLQVKFDDAAQALRMSYLLGPNEQFLRLRRIQTATAMISVLPDDVHELYLSDIRAAVTSGTNLTELLKLYLEDEDFKERVIKEVERLDLEIQRSFLRAVRLHIRSVNGE